MKTKKIICKSQVRAIEDVVDAWKPDHHSAMVVRDIEDVIGLCLFLTGEFGRWREELWRSARAGIVHSPEREGQTLLAVLEHALAVMPRVRVLIDLAEKAGYTV